VSVGSSGCVRHRAPGSQTSLVICRPRRRRRVLPTWAIRAITVLGYSLVPDHAERSRGDESLRSTSGHSRQSARAVRPLPVDPTATPSKPSRGSQPRSVGPRAEQSSGGKRVRKRPSRVAADSHQSIEYPLEAEPIGAVVRGAPGDARNVRTSAGGCVYGASSPRTSAAIPLVAFRREGD